MCRERVKDWNGDDPKCAFPDGGVFSPENWNCATANAIRELCEEGVWCEDQYYQTLNIHKVSPHIGDALWVTWYKRRGRTDDMWLLGHDPMPRRPTEQECLAILATHPQN
jgi:hypothetical protein